MFNLIRRATDRQHAGTSLVLENLHMFHITRDLPGREYKKKQNFSKNQKLKKRILNLKNFKLLVLILFSSRKLFDNTEFKKFQNSRRGMKFFS